jgi:hypothetical protein
MEKNSIDVLNVEAVKYVLIKNEKTNASNVVVAFIKKENRGVKNAMARNIANTGIQSMYVKNAKGLLYASI